MKAFMLAYDVADAETGDYVAIDEAIKPLGKVVFHNQGSVRWISECSSTAAQIKDTVVRAVPRRKVTIWVTEAGSDRSFHPS